MSQKPQMPLSLAKKRAESEIKRAVNAACAAFGLPFFELEDILFRIEVEVRTGAERERRNAEISYNNQLEEYQKQQEQEMTDGVSENAESAMC